MSSDAMAEERGPLFRIIRNAASILAGGAAGEILTTYAIGLAALSLGAGGFGTLSTAQAFAEPFGSIAGFGLSSVAVTLAAHRGITGALRGTLLVMLGGFSILATILALLAGALTDRGGPMPLLALATLGTMVGPITLSANLPFQVHQTMHRLVALPLLSSIVRIATAGAAYYLMRTAIGFQLSGTVTGIFSVIVIFVVSARTYPTELTFDRALARELVILAWPAAALEFVVMAYMRMSYFLLHDAGPVVQGEYAAADRLVRPVLGLSTALAVSALPTVARIASEKKFDRLKTVYGRTIARCAAVLVPLACGSAYLAPLLIRRFAPEYAGSTTPFRVLLAGVLCMFLNQLSTTFIVAMGRFRLVLGVALVNLAVYLALATHLIPTLGATGAAVSTSVMEGINTVMQIVIVFHILRKAAALEPHGREHAAHP